MPSFLRALSRKVDARPLSTPCHVPPPGGNRAAGRFRPPSFPRAPAGRAGGLRRCRRLGES